MANDTFDILRRVVAEVTGPPGWMFRLVDEAGALRLVIYVPGVDTYNPSESRPINHFHPVPTATYNEKSWRRWVFDQCMRVALHEMGEWVKWGKERPFAPLHGPGEDPYTFHEFRDAVDRRTLQDGTIIGEKRHEN